MGVSGARCEGRGAHRHDLRGRAVSAAAVGMLRVACGVQLPSGHSRLGAHAPCGLPAGNPGLDEPLDRRASRGHDGVVRLLRPRPGTYAPGAGSCSTAIPHRRPSQRRSRPRRARGSSRPAPVPRAHRAAPAPPSRAAWSAPGTRRRDDPGRRPPQDPAAWPRSGRAPRTGRCHARRRRSRPGAPAARARCEAGSLRRTSAVPQAPPQPRRRARPMPPASAPPVRR